MITVTYKKSDGTWVADGSEHLLLDQAKAHAAQYPEYRCWDGDLMLAHLFNKDVPQVNVPNNYETIVEPEVHEEEDHEEDDE